MTTGLFTLHEPAQWLITSTLIQARVPVYPAVDLRLAPERKTHVTTNPIHVTGTPENEAVQAIDVRLYYPAEYSREECLDQINAALSQAYDLVSAYELSTDGFGRLTPRERPIA